jgi:hypothetical protein
MENALQIDVAALDSPHRRALEDVIGRQLTRNERLVIRVVEVEENARVEARPAQSVEDWEHVYDGLTDDEIEAIVAPFDGFFNRLLASPLLLRSAFRRYFLPELIVGNAPAGRDLPGFDSPGRNAAGRVTSTKTRSPSDSLLKSAAPAFRLSFGSR